MIILRNKNYSLLGSLKNLFSSGKSQKEIMKPDTTKAKVLYSEITFKEGYDKDYWPALVVLHIKSNVSEPNGGWEQFAEWMSRNKLFEKGGTLTEIHPLSSKDNVNGKNGASATVLVFSNDTKISTSARLAYGQYFKWPEDFFCTYNSYYTWYKSGKELGKEKNFSVKYNPNTGYYEGKVTKGDTLKSAAILGGTGAVLGGLAGSAFGNKAAMTGAKIGGALGASAGLYFTRQSRFDKYNKKVDAANQLRKEDYQKKLIDKRNSLPLSYSDFHKKYPLHAAQLKGYESQCFNDEYPGDIVWYEQGGLEKGRYLPIAAPDEYNNLMFDTKTKKYVVIDSEELEPTEISNRDVKVWFKNHS